MKKFYLLSLGCSKNTVDSERLAALLASKFEPTDDPSKADLIFVNTCGFIDPAKEESIDAIIELSRLKKPSAKLVAFGCLVKRYFSELKRELTEADLLLPTEPFKEVCDLFSLKNCDLRRRLPLTPPGYAYLKISEGCNRTCAFCAIPSIRGPYRSKPIEELVEEAKLLKERGVRELVLVSQDTSYYGKDLYGSFRLPALLDRLAALGFDRLRLHYLYPARELFELIDYAEKNAGAILPYFDVPVQHVSDKVLKAMRRGHGSAFLKRLFTYARERLGDRAVFRTSVIVGFPAEGEREFRELLNFVSEFEFDYLGVFKYYHEEGTPAFKAFKDEIDDAEKERRKEELENLQAAITELRLSRFLNTEQELLIDGFDDESGLVPTARAWFQAPEVDGLTFLDTGGEKPPRAGEVVKGILTQQTGPDFKAIAL